MRLKDVMTPNVERIRPQDSPTQAQTLMRVRRVHHLVVVEDHEVAGIVTEDQLRAPEAAGATSVADVMSRRVVTATPGLTVRKAANLMRGSAAGALPVLDRGRLVGIVTVSDLLELIGRGSERAVQKTKRWTLRHRGIRPKRSFRR